MTKTTSRTRKQSLRQAIQLIRSGRGLQEVTRCGIGGCPVGGWAETEQAMRRVSEELPLRSERSYSVDELISALYYVDAAGRYQYREAAE